MQHPFSQIIMDKKELTQAPLCSVLQEITSLSQGVYQFII